ncbi:prephenate dehydratase, partial [Candidatus Woesearchaeota archaeon]|nr:prephenate dehydratase [Candidatus Woesearchaeota archaeon]
SRPMKNRQWEYAFYLDFAGDKEDAAVKDALKEVSNNALFLKVLGSYNSKTI